MGRCDAPGSARFVLEPKDANLDRLLLRDENSEMLPDTAALVLIHCVALAMPDAIGPTIAGGKRRHAPNRACLVVAQIENLRLRIAYRIVVPGSQAIHLA